MTTIFTKIINGEIPCHKIAEDDNHFAFLDIMPLRTGHVLVIPKQPIDYIFDLEPEALAALNVFAQKMAKAVKSAIKCTRIGVAVIGLEVPHAHIHLIPMHHVSDMDFTRPKMKPSQEELSETARLIREFL